MLQPFLLELEGAFAGRFFDWHGGALAAEVITARSPSGVIQRTIRSTPTPQSIVLAFGPGMTRPFYDWVGSASAGKNFTRSGSVLVLDPSSKPKSRLQFNDALVESIVVPELNKSQTKEGALVISIKPARTSFNKSIEPQSLGQYGSASTKTWHTCDFRLNIAGLEKDCQFVTRIQPLTLGETITIDAVGQSRETVLLPTGATFSDLKIELPQAQAGGFVKWVQGFVNAAKSDPAPEKDGALELLTPRSAKPYFTMKLSGLGMKSMTQKNVSVEFVLYCNSMTFSASAAALA